MDREKWERAVKDENGRCEGRTKGGGAGMGEERGVEGKEADMGRYGMDTS